MERVKRKNIEGFTLIELLVVIAIIGILSAVTFTAFENVRHQARVARAQHLEARMYTQYIGSLEAEYKFESGSFTRDTSGHDRDLTPFGGVTVSTTGLRGTGAASFDGFADFMQTGTFDERIGDNFMVSVWIKPKDTPASGGVMGGRHNFYGDTFDIKQSGTSQIHGDIGMGQDGWATTAADAAIDLKLNKWHHIMYSVKEDSYAIYIDGLLAAYELISTSPDGPLLVGTSGTLRIGTTGFGSEWFNGEIDTLRIYSSSVH